MAFLPTGCECFEDFTIIAAKAGNPDEYPGATKACTLFGHLFFGNLPTTHFPWHIAYFTEVGFMPLGSRAMKYTICFGKHVVLTSYSTHLISSMDTVEEVYCLGACILNSCE